ncbi:MAG: xanthine dehydrogenase small subunit [Betaproteobacteria bacterium]|nr:xanthine dehydrogenase small subunit [Betaproteobacteria bacterium]
MTLPILELIHRGRWHTLNNVPPATTLLDLLREALHATDVKEGCAAGDCGACTVHLGHGAQGHTVNSCIRMAHSAHGMTVTTASDLSAQGQLHPVQQAMVDHHASQCGFCTPGFVMSLYDLYQRTQGRAVSREEAMEAISGNLCRCTGYRPILDAACAMHLYPTPPAAAPVKAQPGAQRDHLNPHYALPTELGQLLPLRARLPQAQLMAGGTDAGLWVTQQHRRFEQVIDLTRVHELLQVETYAHHLAIGAAVSIDAAFAALAKRRPKIHAFAQRFAGRPVRQSGTLGGNLANGSPIGDSMPLLIALGAQVVLMAWRRGQMVHRHVPLEDYYLGYRQTTLAADEVLCWIVVPHPKPGEWLGLYKVSKRKEDDISSVCLAVKLEREVDLITHACIGVGGVAATPVRARQTEAVLAGHAWDATTLAAAKACLTKEFQPISDMRASADYRRLLLGQLLHRAWLQSQGQALVELEDLP